MLQVAAKLLGYEVTFPCLAGSEMINPSDIVLYNMGGEGVLKEQAYLCPCRRRWAVNPVVDGEGGLEGVV